MSESSSKIRGEQVLGLDIKILKDRRVPLDLYIITETQIRRIYSEMKKIDV